MPLNINEALNQPNRKFEKLLEMHDGESTRYQHPWDVVRTGVGGNFRVMDVSNASI